MLWWLFRNLKRASLRTTSTPCFREVTKCTLLWLLCSHTGAVVVQRLGPAVNIFMSLHCLLLFTSLPCTLMDCNSQVTLHCLPLHCAVLHDFALHWSVLYSAVIIYVTLHCIASFCTLPYSTALHCTTLHCTVGQDSAELITLKGRRGQNILLNTAHCTLCATTLH